MTTERISWNGCIGKRVLCRERYDCSGVFEVKVLEVSDSGKFIKLWNSQDGKAGWHGVDDLTLIEVLPKPLKRLFQ